MSLIKQKDKRSGITYVYESISYWDKDKKQSRSKRRLKGRLNEQTGEIIPTDGRCKKRSPDFKPILVENESIPKRGPASVEKTERKFWGATYLFDEIVRITNVERDLKLCFPKDYKKILSVAYFMILEDKCSFSRFVKWDRLHRHPYGKVITSQRGSELFQGITEDSKAHFFRLQAKRRSEDEYLAYDTTSISSYSKVLKQVRRGKNKENDDLPQINLALLFGEKSRLPFYYRKLPGNATDVKTIFELVTELNQISIDKIKLVMDRGFYSKANINKLYQSRFKFLVCVSTRLSFVKEYIDEIWSDRTDYDHRNRSYGEYMFAKTIEWDYEQKRPYKGDMLKEKRRMYLHLFFNEEKETEQNQAFNARLDELKDELTSGNLVKKHETAYRQFFTVEETKKGPDVQGIKDAINKERHKHGFFALISNVIDDPSTALTLYRTRDVIEKAFGDLKDRLCMRRTLTSSDLALEGKIFVAFIALIILSYIKSKMDETGLMKDFTIHEFIDELDVIECFQSPGHKVVQGEVTKKQEELYRAMGVTPLLSSLLT